MESGINNIQPLLSIAIPTWNRAKTLDKALTFLIPQLYEFANEIELIISDNASSDETESIIRKYKEENSKLNFISNRNEENIQFFGNFTKCRELANGRYIWVLSDDDFVQKGLILKIVECLKLSNNIACVYLKSHKNQVIYSTEICDKELLIEQEKYRLGFISAAIFLNKKENDAYLNRKYANNPFIGFIYLLNSFNYFDNTVIVKGDCLAVSNAKPIGYNLFDVFVSGMQAVIQYMNEIQIDQRKIKKFRVSYLLSFIRPIYFLYKAEGNLRFSNASLSSISYINDLLFKNYWDLISFWLWFSPLFVIPRELLMSILKLKRLINTFLW